VPNSKLGKQPSGSGWHKSELPKKKCDAGNKLVKIVK